MSCHPCRDWLLEADPGDIVAALTGSSTPGSDHGAASRGPSIGVPANPATVGHLQSCAACASAARHIVAANDRLAAELEAVTPVRSVDEAVRVVSRTHELRKRRIRTSRAAAAAAAIALGILSIRFVDRGVDPSPGPTDPSIRTPVGRVIPEVEASEGESVVVLENGDESVVVFWFYQGRGE